MRITRNVFPSRSSHNLAKWPWAVGWGFVWGIMRWRRDLLFQKHSRSQFWNHQKLKKNNFPNPRNIMASTHFPNKVRRDEPWKIVKGTTCVLFTSNLSLLPPPTSQRQPSWCQEPLISCQSCVKAQWLALSEWNLSHSGVTLSSHLHLNPLSFFCGVASIFFPEKIFKQNTREIWYGG